MSAASESIDAAIREAATARLLVSKIKGQVRGVDAVASLKAVALTWFNTHRPAVSVLQLSLDSIDEHYKTILSSVTKSASRQTYLDALKEIKKDLVALQAEVLTAPVNPIVGGTDDAVPDFSPLVGNEKMREILMRRWYECSICVNADAHLAAIVMMGGLLEALFVARANRMTVKDSLINALSAPKDKSSGKTLNYQEWMLDSYIKVAYELKWITESAKDVANVLKEYRNYIHPEKELRHGNLLSLNDSTMFWQITKALIRQLLMSAAKP